MAKVPHAGGASQADDLRRDQLEQLDFEIGFFDHILARSPNSVDVLRIQSELLSRRGLTERALEADRRLVALRPSDCRARYNLACSLAVTGRQSEALTELRCAVELGYADLVHLEHDPDLDSLRNDPRYAEIIVLLTSRQA